MDTDVVSMDVTASMEQLLTNVEDMGHLVGEEGDPGPSTYYPTSPPSPEGNSEILHMAKLKMETEEGNSNNTTTESTPRASHRTSGVSSPSGQDSSDGGPLVIDLSDDDDDQEYSKENIEKAPAKSLTGLIKSFSNDPTADTFAKVKLAAGIIPRELLEEMFCTKVSDYVEMEKHFRRMEVKIKNFLVYSDKVSRKVTHLESQSVELASGMKNVAESMTRNPKNAQGAFTPIKFLRTVGIQCRTDPMPRLKTPLGTSKAMNTPPPPLAPMKKVVSSVGTGTNSPNGLIITPTPVTTPLLPQKRLNKATVDVGGIINQIQTGISPPKMRRPGPASRGGGSPAQPKPQQNGGVSPVTNGSVGTVATNGTPTLNGFIEPREGVEKKGNGRSILINQNGVQYRVGTLPEGVQIVTSTAGGYQLVPSGQGGLARPVFVSQSPRGGVGTQLIPRLPPPRQQSLLRNGAPGLPLTLPRPNPTRLSSTVNISPVSNGTGGQLVLGGSRFPIQARNNLVTSTLPKFLLPEFPLMTPQPKKPKENPPRPTLTLQEQGGGIVLSWTHVTSGAYAEIQSYQIFVCQEPISIPQGKILPPQWKKIGDVKALPLPMACTLSQFTDESRYHFIVRGVDVYNRSGEFCECVNILLSRRT